MAANGDMLRVARHRRGFQQTEAAKRLGVDQSLLSRFENGLVEPRDDVVMKASRVYEMPVSFFESSRSNRLLAGPRNALPSTRSHS